MIISEQQTLGTKSSLNITAGPFEKGEIYQVEYSGFYSMRAEQFLQEKDKVNGEWPDIFGEVTGH